tara:strand:+ start:142 stop:1029 length:888 start_codon:yes stop_codon:yes gene_type:complete
LDKETHKKLTANFPKSVVKKAPQGKYGDYVPHHIYTKRLVDVVGGKYNFTYDIIRDKDNAVVGAKCTLQIDDLGTVQEVGDVDRHALGRNLTESEILKLAVSDGIKRCCMRFGIGLELWTGGVTEEEHYAGANSTQLIDSSGGKVTDLGSITYTPPKEKVADNLNVFIETFDDSADKKANAKKTAYQQTVEQGAQTNVEKWTDDQQEMFYAFFEVAINQKDIVDTLEDAGINAEVKEVVVKENNDKITCDNCKSSEYVEDNSEKKASDPAKYGKIPTLVCSNYGSNEGCGEVIEW